VGLRTVEVVHERDAAGKCFTVRVNGAPVFMKGANWIPADSFLPRVTSDRYRALLGAAADAHMNMLRVWGGGVYEDDRFYDLCDELGLLVWQDFMFACSMYPGDAGFVENVRHEAVENVRRLRNHPCLALWAGNNENEVAWRGWGWPAKFGLSRAAQATIERDYRTMFHEVLPAVVAAEDPGRFYTRSSPSANEERVPANQPGWGDMHYWGVWHAERPYEAYADPDNVSRFMSEYGFQSFPELASVARYTDPETDWAIESEVMRAHQRHPRGNALITTYMERDFRRPEDFPSFLHVAQVLQATVIKYAAEAHRRAMGRTWGSLYWQLDDCWPVASWSGIDYYGRRKALHWFARRFFAPILVSPVERKRMVEVWGVSDRRTDAPARLTLRLIDFGGHELWRTDAEVTLAANSSRLYARLTRRQALAGAAPARVVLVAELAERGTAGALLSRNLLTFVKDKELELPRPRLRLEVEPRPPGSSFDVKVTSDGLARHVFLTASEGAEDGAPPSGFDDNYFDLLPDETRVVGYHPGPRPSRPMTASDLQASLRVTPLIDVSTKRQPQK
jgi:beta-mannosidase